MVSSVCYIHSRKDVAFDYWFTAGVSVHDDCVTSHHIISVFTCLTRLCVRQLTMIEQQP